MYPSGTSYDVLDGRVAVSPLLDPNERTGVLPSFGQSQGGNSGIGLGYVPLSPKAHNLSIANGGVFRAADPMLGNGGTGTAMGTRLIDVLISPLNRFDRTISVGANVGNTSIADWAAGGKCNHRIGVAAARMAAHGYTPTGVLFQQGTTDTVLGTTEFAMTLGLNSVVATIRSFWNCPIWIAKESWYNGVTSDAVRAAQAGVVDNVRVFAGPDADTLDNTYRTAGIDFTAAGMIALGDLWAAVIDNHLATH